MKAPAHHILISRIAPTPSGYLHAGNAFSFVLTYLLVRKMGGKLLLRIDDSDATRARPEFIEDIFFTLEWLGIDYDLGPAGPDDFSRNFSQHHRMELYHSALRELSRLPKLVYGCRCSRRQIQERSSAGLYPNTCRLAGFSLDHKNIAWRIQVPEHELVTYHDFLSRQETQIPLGLQMGDFVIRRKDGIPAYQLISLCDDMHFGVNFVVRGSDLRESTAAQLYLSNCLQLTAGAFQESAKVFQQAAFCHHPLIRDAQGEKLSKSKGAASILQMREAGKSPVEIYQRLAHYLGLPPKEVLSLQDLMGGADIKRIQEFFAYTNRSDF